MYKHKFDKTLRHFKEGSIEKISKKGRFRLLPWIHHRHRRYIKGNLTNALQITTCPTFNRIFMEAHTKNVPWCFQISMSIDTDPPLEKKR